MTEENNCLKLLHASALPAPRPRISVPPLLQGLFLGLVLLVSACAPTKPVTDPTQDRKAAALVMAAREKNSDIATTKGLGQLTLIQNQGKENQSQETRSQNSFRIAWAAQAPNKLRLTLLTSAHPVETIAASGDRVSVVSHTGRHKPLSTTSTDPDLSPYINMPVRLSNLISLFLARFPLRPFDRAWFVPEATDRVRTSQNFSPYIQEVQFDPEGEITAISLLNRDSAPVLRIEYRRFQALDGRVLPTTLTLTNARGLTLDLTLESILLNVEVKPSVFRLTEPGS